MSKWRSRPGGGGLPKGDAFGHVQLMCVCVEGGGGGPED